MKALILAAGFGSRLAPLTDNCPKSFVKVCGKPIIVKQIENTDTGSIEVVETEVVRQVVSKETADKVKNMMLSVVTDGTGKRAQVAGYSIGGKSGTSEPRPDKKEEGYAASFIAASPIENTQLVVLFTLYGLQESADHQGGQVAAPFVSKILSETLPYLGIESTAATEEVIESTNSLITEEGRSTTSPAAIRLYTFAGNILIFAISILRVYFFFQIQLHIHIY